MKTFCRLLILLSLAACSSDATRIYPAPYSSLDGWGDDAHAIAFHMFVDSCEANAKRSNAYVSKAEGPIGVREHWEETCRLAQGMENPSNEMARAFFETHFTPYKVETESKSTGTLTGYYEPLLNGSLTRKAPYLTPVYGVPGDLGTRKPYYTRAEIEGGALAGRAPVLLYVDDPVMLFFLHIQGSGKVRLRDGKLVGLQYAGQNGHKFVPIGRVMKEQGILTKASMQEIRDWLRANPDQAAQMMDVNPSYVFFKLSPGDQMAKGALGIPLTPLRSLAIDDDRATYGVPTYLDAVVSNVNGGPLPLKRLFLSQDTGGALKGPHRGDIFFGRGEDAEWQAGHQNAQGNIYWLLPAAPGAYLQDGLPVEKPEETAPAVVPEVAPEAPLVTPPTEVVPDAPLPDSKPVSDTLAQGSTDPNAPDFDPNLVRAAP